MVPAQAPKKTKVAISRPESVIAFNCLIGPSKKDVLNKNENNNKNEEKNREN